VTIIGQTTTTVGEEKHYNPRLTKPVDEFIKIMENLNLPYPKMIGKLKVVKLLFLPNFYGEMKKIYIEMGGSSKMLVITHKIMSYHNPEDFSLDLHTTVKTSKFKSCILSVK
jgi:hypothetical protein